MISSEEPPGLTAPHVSKAVRKLSIGRVSLIGCAPDREEGCDGMAGTFAGGAVYYTQSGAMPSQLFSLADRGAAGGASSTQTGFGRRRNRTPK